MQTLINKNEYELLYINNVSYSYKDLNISTRQMIYKYINI